MIPTVRLNARGTDRYRGGHPWIYRSDLTEIRAAPGDVVRAFDPHGRVLGQGLYSSRSQIALRMLTRGDTPVDAKFWRTRLEHAIRFRDSLRIDASAYRLVHGEADLLPSLVVDRYADFLVVQALSQGMDRVLPDLVPVLAELTGARGVLARNDPRVRALEGLDRKVELLMGDVPEVVEVFEGRARCAVDPWRGQKTGLFLDQRENREASARYAHGRLLDCFSYNGGFALALSPRCTSTLAIDISEEATARISANAQRNGIAIETRTANVFDELRELDRAQERFDTIVLDPPAFAKNKASLERALAGYKEINLRALKLLAPGGYLVTCTCSYHVDEAVFGEVVLGAALDAQASLTLVEKRMQGRDHPVLLGVPETYYLKCFILRRLA